MLGYAPRAKGEIGQRTNGALVSMAQGKAVAYTLFDLQERGSLFIGHGVEVYEGIDDDEVVEVTPTSVRLRKKHLTENERKRESRKAADG